MKQRNHATYRRHARGQKLSARENQIIKYIPLVRYVVARMFSSVPSHVDREDMFQAGMVGLIQAVDQFDPNRMVRFESYAIPRIRGAIIDSFREADWAPRSIRQKTVGAEKAIAQLEAELGRSPNEAEVASKLGISLRDYQSLLGAMSAVRIFSLDHPFWKSGQGGERAVAPPQDAEDRAFEMEMDSAEMRSTLSRTLQELPERERLILVLYYYENLTLKEIATVLNITESRVSQLHTQAILKIRTQLKKANSLIE